MKLVFLDRKTIGDDIDFSRFEKFGDVTYYSYSAPEEIPERVKDADIVITNKVPIRPDTIGTAENLKLVCVAATGTNNIDKAYLEERGISWRNVAGYSTETVAQHTFSLLFYLLENMNYYDRYVKDERYANDRMFTHFDKVFHDLSGMTWGIIGLGAIGRRVAEIAQAFGCKVIYYSTSGRNHNSEYEEVDFDTLLKTSDIVSIHAPLTPETENLINRTALQKMKKSSILINVGRGPILVEQDLYEALTHDEIAGAGLDVLVKEPMDPENPLLRIKDSGKLIITPHIAWASHEARERLMNIIVSQIEEFVANEQEAT